MMQKINIHNFYLEIFDIILILRHKMDFFTSWKHLEIKIANSKIFMQNKITLVFEL